MDARQDGRGQDQRVQEGAWHLTSLSPTARHCRDSTGLLEPWALPPETERKGEVGGREGEGQFGVEREAFALLLLLARLGGKGLGGCVRQRGRRRRSRMKPSRRKLQPWLVTVALLYCLLLYR